MNQTCQRTIARPVETSGRGLHTGSETTLRFVPAPVDSGVRFVRTDLEGRPFIPARVDFARGDSASPRCTTLGNGEIFVGTVEHVLAAVAGLGIDNLDIELSAPEPCEHDGSSRPFVQLLSDAQVVDQTELRHYYEVKRPISLTENGNQRILLPYDGFRISFTIDYPNKLVGTQFASFELDSDVFRSEIAPARTFAMLEDVEPLRKSGLIQGGSLANAVVVTESEIKSDEPLRFDNEFVRHKILDLIGDMALLGMPLKGHLISVRGGHSVNVAFVKKVMEEAKKSYRWRVPGQKTISLDINDIQEIMPHRYPMLLVDRIVELEDRKRVVGIKNVTINEPFFQGHFPGHPIMPAVLIIEAMAQAGGVLLLNTVEHPETKLMYFIGIDNAKFRKPVLPGDTLRFELTLTKLRNRYCKMHGEAFVGDELVAEADLLSTVVDRKALGVSTRPRVALREPRVHDTAVVHPTARLAPDVIVGPYCVVGEEVELGRGCELASHVRLDGPMTVGENNRFFHGAAVGAEPQDLKFAGARSFVRVGRDNVFREFVTVNRATNENGETIIGNSNLLMAYVHVAHDCVIEDHAILANSVNLAGHVLVENYAIIGGVTPVHQFVRVGRYSIVGGGSRVPKDMPPFMKAAGNPLRVVGPNALGLERHEFPSPARRALKEAFRILYRCDLNVTQALDRMRSELGEAEEVRILMDFILSSERGIVR